MDSKVVSHSQGHQRATPQVSEARILIETHR